MPTSRHYEFEGVKIDIPMHYDEKAKMYIEDFPDFVENPLYTPAGCPVMFPVRMPASLQRKQNPAVAQAVPAVNIIDLPDRKR